MRTCFLTDGIITVPCHVLRSANGLCHTSSTRTLIHSWGVHVEATWLIHPSKDPPKIRTSRVRFQQMHKAKGGKPSLWPWCPSFPKSTWTLQLCYKDFTASHHCHKASHRCFIIAVDPKPLLSPFTALVGNTEHGDCTLGRAHEK